MFDVVCMQIVGMNETTTVKEVVDIDRPNKRYTLQSANVSGVVCSNR